MAHVVEKNDVRPLANEAWLQNAQTSFDVAATLTSALTPSWLVEREIDPDGELSIVVLPDGENSDRPTFLLYEENGLVQVSAFRGEDWQRRQAFRTCQRAVAAIIAAANSPAVVVVPKPAIL